MAGASVCDNCGSFTRLERDASDGLFAKVFRALEGRSINDFTAREIAVALAFIPLVVGPPVAAIAIALLTARHDRSIIKSREWKNLVCIALVNIVLSLLFWTLVSAYLAVFMSDIIVWIKAFLIDGYSGSRLKPIPV